MHLVDILHAVPCFALLCLTVRNLRVFYTRKLSNQSDQVNALLQAKMQKFIQILNECISHDAVIVVVLLLLLLFFCHLLFVHFFVSPHPFIELATFSMYISPTLFIIIVVHRFWWPAQRIQCSLYFVGISMLYALCVCLFLKCWRRWCNTNK